MTWLLLAWLAVVGGRGSAAAAPPAPVALAYEAPPGCPDRAAYVSRVAVHSRGAALIDAPGRVFVVRVDARDGRYAGDVTIVAGSDQTHRAIEAGDCVALVDALALVTVLALDPHAADVAPSAPPSARAWQLAIGAGATGVLGVAPDALPSITAFAQLDRRGRGALRLAARWGRATGEVGTARAIFTWPRIQLDACPLLAARAVGPVALGACAGVQLGVLQARGSDIVDAQDTTRPWVAPVATARARWRPTGRWFAELDLTAAFPLVRDQFFFEPDTTIHRAPAVIGELAIVAGVSIP